MIERWRRGWFDLEREERYSARVEAESARAREKLGDLNGFVGRRCGRFRVRHIRGRNVMVNELHDVYVQRIMWR